MIYIEKNSTNNFVLTVSETSKLVNPYYVFSFTNEFNLESEPIIFSTPDISSYPDRYNQFVLVEGTTGSTGGGYNVTLSLISGQFRYKVYESLTQTLDLDDTTGVVLEEGRMVVSGNDELPVIGQQDSVYI